VNSATLYVEITGFNELSEGITNFYPNLVRTSIQIQLSSPDPTYIAIFNLLGEKVKEEKVTGKEVTLDVSSLPQGLYLVRTKETTVGKFVKE